MSPGLLGRVLRRARHGPLPGAVEIPQGGTTLTPGRHVLIGWAQPARRALGRIEVRVNGRPMGRARPLARARADVARWHRAPGAPLAGYEHSITIEGPAGSVATIEVDVVDLAGHRAPLPPRTLTLGPAGPEPDLDALPAHPTPVARALDGRLRLFCVTHQLDTGGGQLYLQDLLRRLGPDVTVLLVSGQDGELRAELETLGVEVHVGAIALRELDAYEARGREIEALVQAWEPHVAVINTMGGALGADVAARAGVPVVWAIHEHYALEDYWFAAYGEGGVDPRVRRRAAQALASSAALVFEADATRARLSGVTSLDRMVTIRYGVELDVIDGYRASHSRTAARHALGIDDDATVVLCMGTFEARKAQAALAVVFAELATEFPDAVLVMVGAQDNEYSRGTQQIVDRLGLGARVRVEPVTPDPNPWYLAADLAVSASDVESMPRSLIEVMRFGVLVVAAGVGGVPELVEDGRTGVVFAPRDLGALRDALRRALRLAPEERERMVSAAQEFVGRHHDVHDYVEAYRRLLFGLAQDPTAKPGELV